MNSKLKLSVICPKSAEDYAQGMIELHQEGEVTSERLAEILQERWIREDWKPVVHEIWDAAGVMPVHDHAA